MGLIMLIAFIACYYNVNNGYVDFRHNKHQNIFTLVFAALTAIIVNMFAQKILYIAYKILIKLSLLLPLSSLISFFLFFAFIFLMFKYTFTCFKRSDKAWYYNFVDSIIFWILYCVVDFILVKFLTFL